VAVALWQLLPLSEQPMVKLFKNNKATISQWSNQQPWHWHKCSANVALPTLLLHFHLGSGGF